MKLISWAQNIFLAGVSLLIIRNNYFPWFIKRSSDILFLLSICLILIFIAANKDWGLVLKIIKKISLPITLIFIGLLIASLNGYFRYGIKIDSRGYLALFRLVEVITLVFSVGFFQNYNSNFYKKVALAQLSTIIYLVGYTGISHMPDFGPSFGRFTLFENFPSNIGYYLLASLSLIYIWILDNLSPFNKKFFIYLSLGTSLSGIMVWTQSRGAWIGLMVAILIVIPFWLYRQKAYKIKNFISGTLVISFCLIIGFLLLSKIVKSQFLLRFSIENSRIYLWKNYTKQLIKDPLGLGLSYPLLKYEGDRKGPHNTLLEFWLMGSFLAVIGFLTIYYQGIKNIILKIAIDSNWQWKLSLSASLIALFVASLLDNMNSFRLMWILIGLAVYL